MSRSRSKRSPYKPPARRNPTSSPRWVPVVGLVLVGLGILVVVLSYIVRLPGGALNLVLGFGLMAGGLVALSRFR